MTGDLNWAHAIDGIPDAGLKVDRAATEEERQGIAVALDLIACTKLMTHYVIAPSGEGHFRLSGWRRRLNSPAL